MYTLGNLRLAGLPVSIISSFFSQKADSVLLKDEVGNYSQGDDFLYPVLRVQGGTWVAPRGQPQSS